jgi:hypothetical protein
VARNVRSYGKPAFNNESGRERRHLNDDPVHRRKQGWIWNATGSYWTWHSWEGCEGIDDPAYRGPGAEYLRPMSDFWQALPFWRLHPNHTVFVPQYPDILVTALAASDRGTVVAYLCTRERGTRVPAYSSFVRLPGGMYRLTLVDPVTLEHLMTREITSSGLGRPVDITLPPFQDDVVVLIEKVEKHEDGGVPDAG